MTRTVSCSRHPGRPWRLPSLTAVAAAALTGLLALGPATSAAAATDPSAVRDTLAAVPEANLLEDVAAVAPSTSTSSGQILTVDTPATDTVVPEDPATPVRLTSQQGKEVALTLPWAETSQDAVPVDNGVVAFANERGFTSVPVVKEDGSAQVALMVESAEAPQRYPFQVGLPEGATASVTEDGGVVLTSAEGGFLGGLTPPWAKDADGNELATRYEVDDGPAPAGGGVTVTQVIDHQAGGTAYPVVADPWLGIDLFAEAEYDRPETDGHGDVVLSVLLSAWGWFWYLRDPASGVGVSILVDEGWDEVVDKLPRADDKLTIQQQYNCHVFFGYNILGAGVHWDFEMFRPDNPRWYAVWEHRCNWE